jgi:hypothetical protein
MKNLVPNGAICSCHAKHNFRAAVGRSRRSFWIKKKIKKFAPIITYDPYDPWKHQFFFIQIAIIKTVYMPQKVLFGPIFDPFEAGT